MPDKITMTGAVPSVDEGPEQPAPRPPKEFGPGTPVAKIFWRKDVALQIPGGGAAQTRLVAWEQMKTDPSYLIEFLPKVQLFWIHFLGPTRVEDGVPQNPEAFVPLANSITWFRWRGEEDIPAAARRRRALAASATD